eukprot:Phypoly_transcript_00856.p1 GENE.Phypoly_transcript_00856~~Phypoly_transcript_00856.p1  ORF type:complete len:1321 (+),score=184.89 Phypoly_transcript_00856:66-3965(+)
MSQLVLPIALWAGPPPHSVTAMIILSRSALVTGSNSGQLCIWTIDSEQKSGGLAPFIFCLGHSAPISALVECSYEENDAFVSISTDGVTHLWRAQDGKCLKGTKFTSFHPLMLACVPGDRRVVAIAGCHCDIELVDAWTLKPISTLRGHQDWVTCLGTTLSLSKDPILVSGSRDGLVHFWSTKPSEDTPLRTVCVDDQGPAPNLNPIGLVVAPDVRSFVIVTPDEWTLYTAQNSHFVCAVACPQGAEWLGAKYLDPDTLLVWTSNALAATYKIYVPEGAESLTLVSQPPLASQSAQHHGLSPHAHVRSDSAFLPILSSAHYEGSAHTTTPAVLYTINEFPPDTPPGSALPSPRVLLDITPRVVSSSPPPFSTTPPTLLSSSPLSPPDRSTSPVASLSPPAESRARSSSIFSFFDPSTHQYESSFSQFAACRGNLFALGDVTGHVGLWNVRPEGVTFLCSGRISDGWKGVSMPVPSQVTATLVLEDSLILIRGHENGQISTAALPTDSFPKFFKAHTARVNCLLCSPILGLSYPSSQSGHAALPRRLLVSGSDDFTIKVWELPTFELLQTFSRHTAPITSLFSPPPHRQSHDGWDNTFFAVSEDKCVGLYSMDRCLNVFGVHPALISAVKSKWEQDYLVVECVDGSVAVWELGTGQLEGILFGQVARDISESSDTIWTSYNHAYGATRRITIMEPGGAGVASPLISNTNSGNNGISARVAIIPTLLHRTPIQILNLDIKQIIRELYRIIPHKEVPLSQSVAALAPPSPPQSGKKRQNSVNNSINIQSSHMNSLPPRGRQTLQVGPSGLAGNIFSLPTYQIYSYLIPWGFEKSLDALCKKETMLRPPDPHFAFGLKGEGGTLSLLVPAASEAGRWKVSPELTSTITLSAVSLSKALLNLGDAKNSCIQVLSYYCTLLPEILAHRFMDSPLLLLASYWLDPLEDVQSASRSILFSTIDRLSAESRRELTESIATQLKQTIDPVMKGLLVIVLGIIGAERPEALDEYASKTTAVELLKILYKGGAAQFTQGAVELLGKGFVTWRPYIKDVPRLIRGLFTLSLQGDQLGQIAHHSLLMLGAQDSKQFLVCIGNEIHRDSSHHHHHHAVPNNSAAAIMVLGAMVKKDPCSQLGQLPRLVETVVKSLDPHAPALRDACLKPATAVLHVMVTKYPMVSFHHDSQRLAVGSSDNVVVIYDLKTASRWHVLEGHKQAISAVAFSENGKVLASYSIHDFTVRIWQTGTSFFGILGTKPPCVKSFTVSKPPKPIAPQTQLQTIKLQWVTPSMLNLVRGWDSKPIAFDVDSS